MNNQDIGYLGEKEFSRLIAQASGCRATPPDDDINGWDLLLECNAEEVDPINVHEGVNTVLVQSKATTVRKRSVPAVLSTTRKLLMKGQPTFFFVPVYKIKNEVPELQETYLVHITDELADKILQKYYRGKIQAAKANKPFKPGRKTVSIPFGKMDLVPPNGAAIISRINMTIGSYPQYVEKRAGFLQRAGNPKSKHFELKFNIPLKQITEEIEQQQMGLLDDPLFFEKGTKFQQRWGLKDPATAKPLQSNAIRFGKTQAGEAYIEIGARELKVPIKLTGKIFAPILPGTSDLEPRRFRIQSDIIDIVSDQKTGTISSSLASIDKPLILEFLEKQADIFSALVKNGNRLSISAGEIRNGVQDPTWGLTGELTSKKSPDDKAVGKLFTLLFKKAKKIGAIAKFDTTTRFSLLSLYEHRVALHELYDLLVKDDLNSLNIPIKNSDFLIDGADEEELTVAYIAPFHCKFCYPENCCILKIYGPARVNNSAFLIHSPEVELASIVPESQSFDKDIINERDRVAESCPEPFVWRKFWTTEEREKN